MILLRKRDIKVTFRLDEEEYVHMKELVKQSKLSQETYIRLLLDDVTPMPALPLDFHKMINELNAIGNNLNQLVRKVNTLNMVNDMEFKEFANAFDEVILAIMEECMFKK